MKQTSIESYNSLGSTVQVQQDQILSLLTQCVYGITRESIAKNTGIMYSSVCARCNELLRLGQVVEKGIGINQSGKRAVTIGVN